MLPESVVDALRKVRLALKPAGVVVDCHPAVALVSLRVVSATGEKAAGALSYADGFRRNIANAGDAFSSLCDEGAYQRGGQASYAVDYPFASQEEWDEYWADQHVYYADPGPEFFANIAEMMKEPGAKLVQHMPVEAIRYQRLG